MLHRIVSRYAGVFAAATLGLGLAACEDNTTGTPLPPPDVPNAYSIVAVAPPDETFPVDEVLSPNPQFRVLGPDGSGAANVAVTFSLNQGGLLQSTSATSDANGFVSPGEWRLGTKAGVQRLVASPPIGAAGFIDVTTTPGPLFATVGPPLLAGKVFEPGDVATSAATFTGVDEFGNRIAFNEEEPVEITVTALQGTLADGGTLEADDFGNVYAGEWTLGGAEGPQSLVASYIVDGLPKADTVTVEALIPEPPEEE